MKKSIAILFFATVLFGCKSTELVKPISTPGAQASDNI